MRSSKFVWFINSAGKGKKTRSTVERTGQAGGALISIMIILCSLAGGL